ncbi:hypothetical protein HWV62_1254 [Athelia sp. TMB]|nr:hypothetical protein HWV62_1254 [Athelia sp. TMB]
MPGPRPDGRAYDEFREMTITYEGLDRVDGSARFGFGETAALASFSGPIEVRLALEHPSHATLEIILRPLSNIPGTEAKSLAATIRNLLTPSLLLTVNPRSLLQLVLQSLSPGVSGRHNALDSRLVAAMINASTLALLNAGSVPMKGVVCAVAVGSLSSSSNSTPSSILVLDPSDEELLNLQGGGCFAFIFSSITTDATSSDSAYHCEPVFSSWQAMPKPFTADELFQARDLAQAGAAKVWSAMKDSVGKKPNARSAFFSTQEVSQTATKKEEDDFIEDGSSDSDEEDAKMEI